MLIAFLYFIPALFIRKTIDIKMIKETLEEIKNIKIKMSKISAEKTKKLKTLESRYKYLRKRITRMYAAMFFTQWTTVLTLLVTTMVIIPSLGLPFFVKSPFIILNGLITFTLEDGSVVILPMWITIFLIMGLQPLYLKVSKLKILYEAKV